MNRSNRRDFLKTAALAGFGAACSPWWARAQEGSPDGRPNIVLVLADDMSWNDMGCMGNPDVKTPNLDRIAEQGAVFDRLYTCTSVCAPTRFQLNTGRMPAFGQVFANNYRRLKKEDPDYPTLPENIQKAGYHAALAGKRHLPDDKLPAEQWKFNYEKLSEQYTTDIHEKAAAYLKREQERPFLLYVGFNEPHVSWKTTGSVTYDPEKLKLQSYMPDNPTVRKTMAAYYGEITALDDKVGAVFDALQASPYKDNTLFLFMTEQGSQIPRGKTYCHDLGMRATMIAHWPGHLKAGRRSEAMLHYVDVLPTLLDLVGAPPAEGIDGKSFLPVLMGESDTFRDEVYGAYGKDRSVQTARYKYIWSAHEPGKPHRPVYARAFNELEQGVVSTGQQASRQSTDYFLSVLELERAGSQDPRVRVIVESGGDYPQEQLYAIAEDPYEFNNLMTSDNPPPEVLADMRRRLSAWLKQQNDPLADTFDAFVSKGTAPKRGTERIK